MPVTTKVKIENPWPTAPPESVEESKGLSVLAYGQTGKGKSRFAASAAFVKELCPVVILDTDFSTESIDWKVPQRRITSYADLIKGLEEALGGKYKTVVIDTATELYQKIVLPEAMRINRSNSRRELDPELAERPDYNRAHSKFKDIMRLIKDSGLNYIVTAQETLLRDPEDHEVVTGVGPYIQGQMNEQIGAFFGIIGRLSTNRDGVTEFNSLPKYRETTKDRMHRIPGVLEFPDMRQALPEIYGYYKQSKAAEKAAKRRE